MTHDGKKKLDEPIAIRPTSETSIYSIYPDLIKSYKDLPLKYNQWCNVVRWEFKDPTPFIRSREFLWTLNTPLVCGGLRSEGHTCFTNKKEAIEEAIDMINLYQLAYRKMSVPTIMGYKTKKRSLMELKKHILLRDLFLSVVRQFSVQHHII